MKKIFLVFALIIAIIYQSNAQITWTKIESGTTVNLNDILFPEDINHGYIVGMNSKVLRTQNGGNSFDTLKPDVSDNIEYKLISAPINFNNCLIVGISGSDINLFLTSTGGQIWIKNFTTYLTIWNPLYISCSFPSNLKQGYLSTCSDRNEFGIGETLNSGSNWTKISSPSNKLVFTLFRNNNNGFVIGENGLIFRTNNAGNSWEVPIFSSTNNRLNNLCYLDKNSNNDWIIVGDLGTILKSIDGGSFWPPKTSGTESNLKAVKFSTNQKVGIAIGEEGKILTSYDKGETWSVYTYPSAENLAAISIPPNQDKVAYIVGSNGLILKSVNITDVEENTNISKINFDISPNPASDNISFSFSNSELSNASISIYNSLGIEIRRFGDKELSGQSSISFSTEAFPPGVYYCTLSSGTNKIMKSFVVVR